MSQIVQFLRLNLTNNAKQISEIVVKTHLSLASGSKIPRKPKELPKIKKTSAGRQQLVAKIALPMDAKTR